MIVDDTSVMFMFIVNIGMVSVNIVDVGMMSLL